MTDKTLSQPRKSSWTLLNTIGNFYFISNLFLTFKALERHQVAVVPVLADWGHQGVQ